MRLSGYSWLKWGSGGLKRKVRRAKEMKQKDAWGWENVPTNSRGSDDVSLKEIRLQTQTAECSFLGQQTGSPASSLKWALLAILRHKSPQTRLSKQRAQAIEARKPGRGLKGWCCCFFFYYRPAQLQRRRGLLISSLCVSRLCAALNRNK